MRKDLVSMKLDRATQLLAEASTIQEARNIVSLAMAAQVYARQEKLCDEAKRYAKQIEIRAKRKLGQILKETPKNKGAMGVGPIAVSKMNRNDILPTYKQIKLDKKLAATAQKIASVEDNRFEQFMQSDGLDVPALIRNEREKKENWDRRIQKAKRRWNLRGMIAVINAAVNKVQHEWNKSCPPDEDRAKIAACLNDHAKTWAAEVRFESCGVELEQ